MAGKTQAFVFVCVLALPLVQCGSRTIGLDRTCVKVRALDTFPCLVTPAGLALFADGEALTLSQLELDGTLTEVMTLPVEGLCYDFEFEHDPASGRMWVIEGYDRYTETPARLRQFDASGQLEWTRELSVGDRPVIGGSLLHHEDALYVAMSLDWVIPPDPTDYADYLSPALVMEKRDLAGELVWTRDDYEYPTPNGDGPLASAGQMHMSEAGLSMVATPPLIDYGPSFPLTIDPEDGEPLWAGADGQESLQMIGDDQQLYLAWTHGHRYDPERFPDLVVVELPRSTLEVITPTGVERAQSEVHWPDWDDTSFRLAAMGDQILSFVDGVPGIGVTVHGKDGTLACQGTLDIDAERIDGRAVELDGRNQVVVGARRVIGDPEDYAFEYLTLLVEPLDE